MSVPMETKVATTPLPLPAHFSQAEQSFSLKKRRLPSSSSSSSSFPSLSSPALPPLSLPPRPPSKGCPPVSRVFPQRAPGPWTPLSRSLVTPPPPASLYDPGRQQSYFSQCFTNLGLLGRGSFGEVYKVLSHRDQRHYAVKRSVHRFRGNSERKRRVREARSHERLCPHPHILGFVAAWEEGGRLYIQTELCCTSLLLHAEAQPPTADEPAAWAYLCDLLSALHHLHARGYAHLDLKPANVFLTRSGRLKLGDFGLLLELPGGRGGREDVQEGDPRYMAPELLRGEYGPAADVFSLGVSILELACNMEVPKGGEGWQQLRQGVLPSEFTNALSGELRAVLQMMLAPEPGRRATVPQLLALPSVRRHRWRRRVSLLLQETLLTLLSLCQLVVSSGWGFLSGLNLPFLPRWTTASSLCTPPRTGLDSELTLPHSAMHADSGSLEEDDLVFLPGAPGPELSPTFSHRVKSRLSVGSTSTPLPSAAPETPLSPAGTPTHSSCHAHGLTHTPPSHAHGLTHTPSCHALTHTPPSVRSDASQHAAVLTPSLSPIDAGGPAGSARSSQRRSVRSWVRADPPLPPRPSFEPKNLLSLFDDATSEKQP